MGPLFSFSGTENEWIDWQISLERELIGNFYEKYKDEFIEESGLNKEDIIIEQTIAPVIITWMSQENIYRLTEHEKVTAIYYYDIDTTAEPEDIVYIYTADDALRILQAVVHLRVGHINRIYDVNGHGDFTSDDALLALKSAVKLVEIRWPEDHVFPE